VKRGKMKIGMVKTRVLVKEEAAKEKSDGGIILPKQDQVKDHYEVCSFSGIGHVVARANNVKAVEVGDKIYFGQNVGEKMDYEGEPYLMMNESDILAVLGD
tara:strand:- start:493 stop:795 length:303 start_codon:yes stop_codon:yes gene_type:complete